MSRVYVGGLPEDVSAREVEDIFYKFGRIRDIDIKIPRGPGPTFGFVEFSDPRDAEDAVRDRDGYRFDGRRLRVEFSRARGGAGGFGGGGGGPRRGGSEYRVAVSGLPISASWQDLKDHFRRAGDVGFADVNRDGTGVVEYSNRADMENAIRKLDGSEFDNRADRATISVREAGGSGGGGGGRGRSPSPRRRSPSPRRSASPRRGSSRDRSRDRGGRSADRSPRRSRSRDRDAAARSRSRSPSPEKRRSASGSPAPAPSSPRD